MARLETEIRQAFPATYVTKPELRLIENRVGDVEDAVKDCEKSTNVLMSRVDISRNEILDRFDKAVVPSIRLNDELVRVTTLYQETKTQLALASVQTKTQTTETTVTVTPVPIPPFWTIIKSWASGIQVVGGAFLTLIAIALVLLAWWIWGVQHTPRP